MIDLTIRRLLALYPRGVSDSQLLWRLKDGGVRHSAADVLNALTALVERGEVSRDRTGRWKLVALSAARDHSQKINQKARSTGNFEANLLYAMQGNVFPPEPIAETLDDDTQSNALPPVEAFLGYFAATQRRDPRGRLSLFQDRHGQSWQMARVQGPWWNSCRLSFNSSLLPPSFAEALSRRNSSGGAALGWPVSVCETPEGTSIVPVLIMAAEWRLGPQGLELDVTGGRPSINPDWISAVKSQTRWTDAALSEILFPEGEDHDLASVSDRLRHALATIGGGLLKPGDPVGELALAPEGLRNALVIALPEDTTFTRGAADDLEALGRNWAAGFSETALGAFWQSERVESYPVPVVSTAPLTDRQLEAAEAALSGPLTVIQGPPGTGKSQVILALVMSAVLSGRTVLFASKNHQALDEVEKRLTEIFPKVPILTRGRDAEGGRDVSMLQALFELADVEPRNSSGAAKSQILELSEEHLRWRQDIRAQLQRNIEICMLVEKLSSLSGDESGDIFSEKISITRRLILWLNARFGLFSGRVDPKSIAADPNVIQLKIASLRKEATKQLQLSPPDDLPDANGLVKELTAHMLKTCTPDRSELSFISDRVAHLRFEQANKAKQLSPDDARLVLNHRPVWAISTLSVPSRVPLRAGLFDYVIFDEASQCDIASALPLLARAKSAVVVGDPQQLRFVASLGNAAEHALMSAAGLPRSGRHSYAQSINSLFDFVARRPQARRFFLKDQFRSAPEIVGYLNDEFYAGLGLEGRKEASAFSPPTGYRAGLIWEDAPGRTSREDGGNVNHP